ncbi:MAG: glycosyltransferase, partial [Planctomycetota bacterium]|nr:glycosyltransferase [Planctomycetota bacterium]
GGIKVVHTIHGLPFHPHERWWLNRLYILLERRAAKYTDAYISVADAMTGQMQAVGVGAGKPFVTIYSGMEVGAFLTRPAGTDAFRRRLALPEGALLVTQVARLAQHKGHEYVLAAASRVRDPNVRFCFVGDGAWRERIARDIHARGLDDRVHLTGLLPPEQMPAVMHATDILVHCSLREGLARTLPQALLAGRPVVSFDVDGAREVVNDRTGVLLAPKDVAGLARAIEDLASDPARRAALGAAGRESCRLRFDHEHMADQIEALYRGLL